MQVAVEFTGRPQTVTEPLQAAGIDITSPSEADIVLSDTPHKRPRPEWDDSRVLYRPRTDILRYYAARLFGGLRGRLSLQLAGRHFESIVAPDAPTATRLREVIPHDVIDIGVPASVDDYEPRDHYGSDSGLTLLTLTNLDYRRKLTPLVEALDVVEAFCAATDGLWVIGGDGAYAATLAEHCSSGRYPHIEYAGFVDSQRWLGRTDVLLHFSELDIQYPNAILEAMAAAVPVVTNPYPSFVDNISLTAPDDRALLSILKRLRDAGVRQRLGDLNREYVATHHSPEHIGQQYRAHFAEVMA